MRWHVFATKQSSQPFTTLHHDAVKIFQPGTVLRPEPLTATPRRVTRRFKTTAALQRPNATLD